MNIERNTKDIKGNALSEMVKEAISMLEETNDLSNKNVYTTFEGSRTVNENLIKTTKKL